MKILMFSFCILFSLMANAQLYRWVDENGKVSYSDKKPSNTDGVETREIVAINKSFFEAAEATERPQPILKSYDRSTREIHFLNAEYFWKKYKNKGKKINLGTYFTGVQCRENKSIVVPDVYLVHKSFFPTEKNMTRKAIRVMRSLEFEAKSTSSYDLQGRLKKGGGLSLHPLVEAIEIETCAPQKMKNNYTQKTKTIEDLSAGSFRNQKIKLSIRWQLKDNRDQDVIYDKVIVGFFDNLGSKSISVSGAIESAMEDAALRLMGDLDFVDLLYVEEDLPHNNTNALELERALRVSPNKVKAIDFNFNNLLTSSGIEMQGASAGRLLFGSRCSAAKEVTWGEMDKLGRRKPNMDSIPSSIMSEIRRIGYVLHEGVSTATNSEGKKAILTANLSKFVVNMCAPSKDSATKYADTSVLASSFNRFMVDSEIKWTLQSARGEKPELILITKGRGGNLAFNSKFDTALAASIESAVNDFLARQEVVGALLLNKKEKPFLQSTVFNNPEKYQPIMRSSNLNVEQVILTVGSGVNEWRRMKFENSAIGTYAIDQECHPYADRIWPDAYNDHEDFFPDYNQLSSALGGVVMQGLDYPFLTVGENTALKQQRRSKKLRLKFSIIDLKADACAPSVVDNGGSNVNYAIFKSKRKLKRHRIQLSVLWQLVSVEQDVVFEALTKGYANNWKFDVPARQTFMEAYTDAAEGLFSQQIFIDALASKAQDAKGSSGFFGAIYDWLNKKII